MKTRLQPVYSTDFSLRLHQQLIRYCLQQWAAATICPLQLWVAGDTSALKPYCSDKSPLTILSQQGNDLGERMEHAANAALRDPDTQGVILVGTDCPFIDSDYLRIACEQLQQYDVVIGPAIDGGYVLLGIKKLEASLFNNIDWGSEQVFQQTLAAIVKSGLTHYELPILADIDRPEDIKRLQAIPAFQYFTHYA